ncbi:hypothetical protein [Deinococcus sp.]|uniref:hypothetical protein n=1 Tax=Deinococcus sp. TaxID=47478 RepID=UPI003CC68A5C
MLRRTRVWSWRARTGSLLALGLLGAVSATGLGMSNVWIDMPLNRVQCVQRATLALKAAGFDQNFEAASESVFADQEDYTVLFRCVPDKGVAYIVVAGPDSELADQYIADIEDAFSVN